MTKKVVASAILLDDAGRLLIGRKQCNGLYCPPGGKVESGEFVKEALVRELREETGLRSKMEDLEFLGMHDQLDKIIIFYLVPRWFGKPRNLEPKKHHDWEWWPELPPERMLVEGLHYFQQNYLGGVREEWRRRSAQVS